MMPDRTTDPHADQPIVHAGPRPENAAAAAILIHGRGATAEDILSLSKFVDREDVVWIAPQASAHTWYPNSFLAPLRDNEPWLSSALRLLTRLVDDLGVKGIDRRSIVVAGFSQGACLASEFVARQGRRFGGLAAFSGGLIGSADAAGHPPHDKSFEYQGSLDGTPVFIGCSDVDPHIPVERVDTTAEVLERLGGVVTSKIYPGMAHTIIDDEIRHFQRLFAAV